MSRIALPHDAKAGPTKPEVRSVVLGKLGLTASDHFVEVGSCTGAVTIEASQHAGRVTALERTADRVAVTQKNLAANDLSAEVTVRETEAPDGLPTDADALFVGGSRNYEAVLDHAVETRIGRVVMNVSRLEVAGAAVKAFRERGLLDEVLQIQVSRGYELAGATSFDSNNPVYVLVGSSDDGIGETSDDGARTEASRDPSSEGRQ